jgi:xylulokinase
VFLGIDIGTSAVKAVIVDDDGRVRARSSDALDCQRPRPGWSEQDPESWWRATVTAIQRMPADARAAVRSIGLTGQMHSATLLDGDDRVLRPAILWNDVRCEKQCRELELAEPAFRSLTGNPVMPGFTAPKIAWVREFEPDVYARIACVLLPKDFVRFRLTGERCTDVSDASGTLWLDVAQRRWSERLARASGLDPACLPRVIEGTEISGELDRDVAERLGLPVVPVAAGGGDNAASAAGLGVTRAGDAFLSLGTSGVLFVVTDRFRPNPDRAAHAFGHCLPRTWHQMAVILSAASAVSWASALCGYEDVVAAVEAAERRGIHEGTPVFLPYLGGERTPHNDAAARGVFFGLSHGSERADLVVAAVIGVSLAFADGLDALGGREAGLRSVSLCGGGARLDWWARVLASTLDVPLVRREDSDAGAALGAARLARAAVTPNADFPEPPIERIFEPDPRLREQVLARRALFQRLYQDLRTHFRELHS